MRIDKFFSELGLMTRKECAKACRAGEITRDGAVVTDSALHIDENASVIKWRGETVSYKKFVYIMLNKPEGYVSSTDERGELTVLDLLPEILQRRGLFPCGRLDKATLGLVILTNDGQAAHRALAPRSHVDKKYLFTLADPIAQRDISQLQGGIMLSGGERTMPCKIEMLSEKEGVITLREGKYHQVRRMFAAVGNKVETLERVEFGGIPLDPELERGAWRYLTEDEEKKFLISEQ